MSPRNEISSGEPAPETGRYRALNVLGSETDHVVYRMEGKPMPPLPRSWVWQFVSEGGEFSLPTDLI